MYGILKRIVTAWILWQLERVVKMGTLVLILGESGSGKSTSMRNFSADEVSVFNVASKPLPFREKLPSFDGCGYAGIENCLTDEKLRTKKTYVIDDSQYLMAFSLFDRAKETGYAKFTDCALNFYTLLQTVVKKLPKDVIVYFLHHTEQTETGKIKAKTSGKMLDSQLTLEGLFSIVLLAKTDGQRYWFETQSDGFNTCKSPIEMFEKEIDNDLKMVDTTIREYWGLEKVKTPLITTKSTKVKSQSN